MTLSLSSKTPLSIDRLTSTKQSFVYHMPLSPSDIGPFYAPKLHLVTTLKSVEIFIS